MCPLGPDSFDLSTCGDFGGQVGGRAAIAENAFCGDGGGGVVVGPLALDGFRGGGGGESCIPVVN